MNLLKNINDWFVNLFRVWRREFRLIFTDPGVLLFFFGLPLAYPVIYTIIYNPETLKDIPVVVVDNSRTEASRQLARMLDQTQGAQVIGYASDLAEARQAWAEKKCYAIMEIPADYAKRLGAGQQAVVSFYEDMSLLLRYRTFSATLADIQLALASQVTFEHLNQAGLLTSGIAQEGMPISNEEFFLGDPTQGFASFIMPGIVVLILQQSMFLGIAMLAGSAAERRRRNRGYDPMAVEASALTTVLGRTLCYVVIYLPLSYYVLRMIPAMFNLPQVGEFKDYMLFIFPMLIASALFAQSMSVLVTERESSMLVVVFTSVIFLFLSGLTWPRYAMNPFWTVISDAIPATYGVEGSIRITALGASLSDVAHYWRGEWLLSAVYLVTAVAVAYFRRPVLKAQPNI